MVFVCPDKCKHRKSLLTKLKDLVDQIDDKKCAPCCPDPCCPAPCCPTLPCCGTPCCANGPVIEIYDPLPKPCLPIVTPAQPCCSPCAPCGSPPCCPVPACCPGTCPPPSTPVPVCCPPVSCPVTVPPCLPICTPVPPPCVPVCNPCPEEQPCVPCNPPQMMVCYRRPKCSNGSGKRSKSRELRASILHVGCDCEKRNGLQDDCPRSECRGSPECMTKPDPTCGPSEFSNGKHLGKRNYGKGKDLEEYQCYPAYVRLPPCPPWH
ncbi:keratin-associated protein 9-1-like [Asbolus verrucosus]|uniref:Keratin-associated protein 9-1-like n=1 Tax=Asbolus verrucosus TaxID=1661398 RepID=A0A482VYM9_ASBVE|nr:keratin-associated protein 9-1-like [Asbolus verrucosus]